MREIKSLTIIGVVFYFCLACGKENPPDVEVTPVQEEVPSPEAAVLLRPVNDEVCTSGVPVSDHFSRVRFEWNAGANTEAYTLKIHNLNNQQNQFYTNIQETFKEVELAKDIPYQWHVISSSAGTNDSAISSPWRFYLAGDGATNAAPYPPQLLRPASGSRFPTSTARVELAWEATDPDRESLTYILYFDTVDGRQSPASDHQNITITQKEVAVASQTTYYWRVQATDPNGNSAFSAVYSFRVE